MSLIKTVGEFAAQHQTAAESSGVFDSAQVALTEELARDSGIDYQSGFLETLLFGSFLGLNDSEWRRKLAPPRPHPVPTYFAIVPQGDAENSRYALAVMYFDEFDRGQAFSRRLVELTAGQEVDDKGLAAWVDDQRDPNRAQTSRSVESHDAFQNVLNVIRPELMRSFLVDVNPDVVYLPVREEFTGTPKPACPVEVENRKGTAGAIATDAQGRCGVTVARHTVEPDPTVASIGSAVDVGGYAGRVVSENVLSDSCFVELLQRDLAALGKYTSTGPLIGVLPPQFSPVAFDRTQHGLVRTTIESWSPDILTATSLSQVKVFTENVLNPGDSGAALRDSRGNILGFAFTRAGMDEKPQYSSWIWADSVFRAHGLTAL